MSRYSPDRNEIWIQAHGIMSSAHSYMPGTKRYKSVHILDGIQKIPTKYQELYWDQDQNNLKLKKYWYKKCFRSIAILKIYFNRKKKSFWWISYTLFNIISTFKLANDSCKKKNKKKN